MLKTVISFLRWTITMIVLCIVLILTMSRPIILYTSIMRLQPIIRRQFTIQRKQLT